MLPMLRGLMLCGRYLEILTNFISAFGFCIFNLIEEQSVCWGVVPQLLCSPNTHCLPPSLPQLLHCLPLPAPAPWPLLPPPGAAARKFGGMRWRWTHFAVTLYHPSPRYPTGTWTLGSIGVRCVVHCISGQVEAWPSHPRLRGPWCIRWTASLWSLTHPPSMQVLTASGREVVMLCSPLGWDSRPSVRGWSFFSPAGVLGFHFALGPHVV